ncbi:MAG: hypothetical protein J7K04_15035 [Spirochaetales bacterium]|nr:hypothetical protein [Spirochaetales bacterium]RKX83880.1 MAG: hypothetical protein DRP57_07025 [Spirochaetota bacterium]
MKGKEPAPFNERNFIEEIAPSNAELKKLLDGTLTRFENWKVEVETNPNPRMVHSLKNLISIIDSISKINEKRISYSYKNLSRQMSILIAEVARLNLSITDSLMDDDMIDSKEERRINNSLKNLIQAAAELIRIVQEGFGGFNQLKNEKRIALPDQTPSDTISPTSDVE